MTTTTTTTTTTSETGDVGAPTPARDKPRKKRSHTTPTRDRERRELMALRVQTTYLTEQLQAERQRLAASREARQRSLRANGVRHFSVAPAWRHIARRHEAARRRAEEENQRLRSQLASHLDWGKQLQEKIQQRTASSTDSERTHPAAAAALGSVARPLLLAEDEEGITDLQLELDDADRAELEMLAGELDAAYSRTGIIFQDQHVDEVALRSAPASRTLQRTGNTPGSGDKVVELRDVRVVPFEFRLVVDAVWNAWVLWHLGGSCRKSVSAHRSCSYPQVARPEHTFAVKFRLQCAVTPQGTVFLDLKLVLRRYMEPGRMILVWRGLSAGERDLAGLSTDETGWVIVERMSQSTVLADTPTATEGVATPSERCVMRSCVRMTPRRETGCSAAQGKVLTDLVVHSYEEDVSFIYREMESQLLRATRH